MKTIRIITLFLVLCNSVLAQENLPTTDSTMLKPKRNFMVGVDVLNAGIATFSDTKLLQGFISTKIHKNIEALAEVGFSTNKYQKNGYNADASGFFVKLGATHLLVKDHRNPDDGFYVGAKLAGAFYNQEYHKIPVRGIVAGDYYETLPQSSQSSYWVEVALGGRVELFQSGFFIDVQVQPRYLCYTTKQQQVSPMIVPGFGKSSTKFNMGFAWAIAYRF